ncbi:MAG: hypothetical protein A3J79_12955, partial [Elusimicrobia bacterium RIFOXYB2_FULL_62_6]
IYNRLAVHFLNDTVEIRPRPVPLPESFKEEPEETEAAPQKAAQKTEAAVTVVRDDKKGKPAPAKTEEPQKEKAVKTIFEFRNASAKSVHLAGSFTKWKELRMTRKSGVWKTEVYILPGNYLYHFVVDGKKTLDPGKPKAPLGESMVGVE